MLILQVKALLLISLLIDFLLLPLISPINMKLRLQYLNLLQLVLNQLPQNAHSVFDILETLCCTYKGASMAAIVRGYHVEILLVPGLAVILPDLLICATKVSRK